MQARGSRVGRCAAGALLLALALGAGAASAVAPLSTRQAPAGVASAPAPASRQAPAPRPLDVNSATPAQLATLPGIGPDEAQRIVAGRPYLTKAELATRKVLPEGLFVQIKGRIVAIQKTGTPRPAAAARKASGP